MTARYLVGGIAAAALGAVVIAVVLLVGSDEDRRSDRPPAREVVASACAPMTYAGDGRPTSLIVLTTALQGAFGDHGVQAAQAAKLVLANRGWRAGPHTVGVQVCDEVPYGSDDSGSRRCASIARAVTSNQAVLGVIGPWSSTCAPMLAILNRAPGPVAMISPSATYIGLTRPGPGAVRGDPARYRPSGRRNFTRVVPADDVQAAVGVHYLRQLGARRLFVLDDDELYGQGLAAGVAQAAQQAGIVIAGAAAWRASARDYAKLAQRVRDARTDAVYLAGFVDNHGPRLIKDLRGALGPRATILGPDGFSSPGYLIEHAGSAAEGFAYTIATLPSDKLPPTGRRFATEFKQRFGDYPCCVSVQTAQAMEIFLDALAASDGSRADVTRNVLRAHVTDGQLGTFHFDDAGDTTATTIAVYRISRGRGRFQTAVTPPTATRSQP